MSKIMYKGRSYANAGVSSDATSIPTADMTAAFDSSAHMNSEDMTATEVSDFVDSLDVQGGGLRIERGSTSFNVTGTTEASTYIAFSEQYDTAPTVMVTLMASYNRRIDVSAVSAYGFTVNGALLSGTSQASIPFMWLAVGN